MNPTPNESPEFNDARGRTWRLTLTINKIRTIKATNGCDFGKIADGKLLMELGTDPERFAQVLWILCETQAKAINVTPEEFAELLDGETIDAAASATIAAVINFTRAPMRAALREVIATTNHAHLKSLNAVESWAKSQSETIGAQAIQETERRLATLGETSPS